MRLRTIFILYCRQIFIAPLTATYNYFDFDHNQITSLAGR